MLTSKTYRKLFALAASTALSGVALADCNCSVPPSPGVSAGVVSGPPWSGTQGYGYSGGYAAHHGYGTGSGYGAVQGYGYSPGSMSATAYGTMPQSYADYDSSGPHWAPGGYEARIGSPTYYYDPAGGDYVVTGNPYYDHFGPGFQRNQLHGHYRFPYYNYRAPWYYPGRAVYNRNTNFAW